MGIGCISFETNQKREITSPPIGPFIAPSLGMDPTFVVIASAIVYPTNAFAHGQPIIWGILNNSTNHNSSFYTSAEGAGSGRLQVNFPLVKSVLNTTITVDESLAGSGIFVGSSTDLDKFTAPAFFPRTAGLRLSGDGSTTWVKNGELINNFDIGPFNPGFAATAFNVLPSAIRGTDYQSISVVYTGPNNYGIQLGYSGLGPYNIAFILIDRATGLPIPGNPTANDSISISNAGTSLDPVPLNTWVTGGNDFIGSLSNFWVTGLYECWMVAFPLGTSAVEVKFQPVYVGATNYKIYRDISQTFSSPVLIYTGTSGSVVDSGLLPNTLYYYKLVGVIGGIDTDITTFRTVTKAY